LLRVWRLTRGLPQALSGSEKDVKELQEHFKKLESFGKSPKDLDAGIAQLDPKGERATHVWLWRVCGS
jgi:hypothetical protein